MNDMRKLMEAVEQINEVDEYTAAGALFQAGFEAGFNADLFTEDEVRKAFREFTDEKYSRGDLGHENALGNDHEANFGGWPDEQR